MHTFLVPMVRVVTRISANDHYQVKFDNMDQDTCEDPATSSAEDESESESSEAEDSLKNGNLVTHSNIKFIEIPSSCDFHWQNWQISRLVNYRRSDRNWGQRNSTP